MSAAELAERVPDDQKARVQEGIDFLDGGQVDAWRCDTCGYFGLLA